MGNGIKGRDLDELRGARPDQDEAGTRIGEVERLLAELREQGLKTQAMFRQLSSNLRPVLRDDGEDDAEEDDDLVDRKARTTVGLAIAEAIGQHHNLQRDIHEVKEALEL